MSKISSRRVWMGKLMVMLVLAWSVGLAGTVQARQTAPTESSVAADVERDLGAALDMWRDGRYDDLYERVVPSGKQSKEAFVKKMGATTRRPTCCWDKLRDVQVTVKNDATVTVRAKLGFEDAVGTETVTRSFKMVRKGDTWRLSQTDIISLAGGGKKKKYWNKHRSGNGESTR
jgi:hypothetical protein